MESKLRPILNGYYSFERLRKGNYIYVDKTAYLHRLITNPEGGLYFLSRPRRFGKSLMISTLKEILQGNRALFDGLAISKTDYDWQPVPVIHLDFGGLNVQSRRLFDERLRTRMQVGLTNASYTYDIRRSPASNFELALQAMTERPTSLAVLIDEYDAPIGHALHNLKMAEYVRGQLEDIYSVLKTYQEKIRFLMITGVSRFMKTSVFSALNNLKDISLSPEYAEMLGYTDAEMDANFRPNIQMRANLMNLSYVHCREQMKYWFNGYCFALGAGSVYNPTSVGAVLSSKESAFELLWTDSARPTVLMNYLKDNALDAKLFSGIPEVSASDLRKTSDLANLPMIPMLYQTGYLTIDGPGTIPGDMKLRIPDEEIRRDLYSLYIDTLAGQTDAMWRKEVYRALLLGDVRGFLDGIPTLFANLHYGAAERGKQQPQEFNCQRILQTMFATFGVTCETEKEDAAGNRSDLVVVLNDFVYIFELKRRDTKSKDKAVRTVTAQDALRQIEDRHYADAYLGLGKKIVFIGMVFDSRTHKLVDAGARPFED